MTKRLLAENLEVLRETPISKCQDSHRRQNAVDDPPEIVPRLMAMPVPMRNNFYIDRHLALNMPVFDRKDEFYFSFAPLVYSSIIFSPCDGKLGSTSISIVSVSPGLRCEAGSLE
jgi:hypothetical protein